MTTRDSSLVQRKPSDCMFLANKNSVKLFLKVHRKAVLRQALLLRQSLPTLVKAGPLIEALRATLTKDSVSFGILRKQSQSRPVTRQASYYMWSCAQCSRSASTSSLFRMPPASLRSSISSRFINWRRCLLSSRLMYNPRGHSAVTPCPARS